MINFCCRAEIEKHDEDKTFYLTGRSRNCIKVDKNNNGEYNIFFSHDFLGYHLAFNWYIEANQALFAKPFFFLLYITCYSLKSNILEMQHSIF